MWKRWIDLLVTAEHYSRDLSKRVGRAYRSKWRHHNDPGGRAHDAEWSSICFGREHQLASIADRLAALSRVLDTLLKQPKAD